MKHTVIELPVRYTAAGIKNSGKPPVLVTYLLDNYPEFEPERLRPIVVLCPGGGYGHLSPREGEAVALKMNSLGFHACVVRYSVAPMDFPAAFLDLCEAVYYIRSYAAEFHIHPEQVIVGGFSAGGHLTASLGVFWNTALPAKYLPYKPEMIKPNALLLSYPVITSGEHAHQGSVTNVLGGCDLYQKEMNQAARDLISLENHVTADVPPVFMWHTWDDSSVPVENSLLFAAALRRAGVPAEVHIFSHGVHGLSLGVKETAGSPEHISPECAVWPELFASWASKEFAIDR